MDFEKILDLGIKKSIINEEQKNDLIDLYKNQTDKPVSGIVKIFYYIGGLIMLYTMAQLMLGTIENSTYVIILFLGTVYATVFLGIGEFLWKKNEQLPAGILYLLFTTTFAFIILDIEKMTGFFPHFADMDKYPNYWDMCIFPVVVLSTITIIANTILQKFRKIPITAIPTVFCSYAIYMSFIDFIYGWENINDLIILYSSLVYAIGLTVVGFFKDKLTKVDYSKWMYLFGSTGIFMSMILIFDQIDAEAWQYQLASFILSLIYILIGLIIQRKPFSVIGILGSIEYILYLEGSIIKNSTLLTSIILLTGLAILYVGVLYNKNYDKVREFVENLLPQVVKKYLPQNRA